MLHSIVINKKFKLVARKVEDEALSKGGIISLIDVVGGITYNGVILVSIVTGTTKLSQMTTKLSPAMSLSLYLMIR